MILVRIHPFLGSTSHVSIGSDDNSAKTTSLWGTINTRSRSTGSSSDSNLRGFVCGVGTTIRSTDLGLEI